MSEITTDARARFQARAAEAVWDGDPRTPDGLFGLAAAMLGMAAAAPERLAGLYDLAAGRWFGEAVAAPEIAVSDSPPEPIPADFWTAFWALLDTPAGTLGAAGVTQRTAALAGVCGPGLRDRAAAAALAYPGCAEAAASGYPERFTLEALARCPKDSLGGAFHALIVDNGFDLEVLDRDALGLADLPPPLDYLNTRILQCHDLWHLAAGYRTTGLHEVAISGFQLGQFGHHYSAMFLGMVTARAALERPESATLLLDIILGGWRHGRESPPILGVDWPAIWDQPLEAIRSRLGLKAFESSWPADLFEQLRAAA
jgi:ubiquinone biosynthesis protein Coq4